MRVAKKPSPSAHVPRPSKPVRAMIEDMQARVLDLLADGKMRTFSMLQTELACGQAMLLSAIRNLTVVRAIVKDIIGKGANSGWYRLPRAGETAEDVLHIHTIRIDRAALVRALDAMIENGQWLDFREMVHRLRRAGLHVDEREVRARLGRLCDQQQLDVVTHPDGIGVAHKYRLRRRRSTVLKA